MDNNKTLIAYATKGKVTKETVELIAEILREDYSLEVDLNDLKQEPFPDVSHFRNVVVGSGVRMGRIYKRALNFFRVLNTLNVEPVSAEAFGGRIRIFGFTLADNVDKEKVKNWASVIGKQFPTE